MKIRVAGHVFAFNQQSPASERLLRDFICDDSAPAEAKFVIAEEDKAPFDAQSAADQREFYALHDKVAHWLLERDVLLFHGSCLALDSTEGILFTAPSGTGKSTHSRLWRQRFGSRVTMINDDKPLLQFHPESGRFTAWGSPWSGKAHIHTPTSVPLRCIVVISQAPENTIRRLDPVEAAEMLLPQALVPINNFALRLKALQLIDALAELPVYLLGCTISQEAVDLSLGALAESAE